MAFADPKMALRPVTPVRQKPLKLIVQIPCYNEAETLPQVVRAIPRHIAGIDHIEILVIDDGSSDGTAEVARAAGVHHVIRNTRNLGLARSFQRGLHACIERGADIIVNTDGDNQYCGDSIPSLIQPVLDNQADITVGDRNPGENRNFSALKRQLQKLGSALVRRLADLEVADVVSGFRAYSRDAALATIVNTTFSYTTETLIHAGMRGMKVVSVPVETNPVTRPSRLFTSIPSFVKKQVLTIVRSYTMYHPLRTFTFLGLTMLLIGSVPIVRFLYFYFIGEGNGHIQSLILGSMFAMLGYSTLVIALLSDAIATNRRLLETTLERVRRIEFGNRGTGR